MPGLSQIAYAAHRKKLGLPGQSRWAVQKALKDGRIKRNKAGKIDPRKADRDWAENTNTSTAATSASGTTLAESRATVAAFAAKTAELDYLERSGKLVEVAEVEREFYELARGLRDRLFSIPARLGPEVAAETDIPACEAAIERELRAALSEMIEKGSRNGNEKALL